MGGRARASEQAGLMCFIVEGDRSLETCMGRGREDTIREDD